MIRNLLKSPVLLAKHWVFWRCNTFSTRLGITGRLNGAGAEAFWGPSAPHTAAQQMHHHSKMPVGPGNGAGWEEPSPPSQRRNVPNYDDGTSLWGNPQQGERAVVFSLHFLMHLLLYYRNEKYGLRTWQGKMLFL